ncbi:hypothetical protein [Streptomyces prunicolor]
MNNDLREMLITLASGAVLAFLAAFFGAALSDWQARRTEARKQRAEDQAELQAQADELISAVLALKVTGNLRDQLTGSRRTRTTVGMHAVVQGLAEWARAGRGSLGLFTGYGTASQVISQWDREHVASAAGLAAPIIRLAAATAPLMRRQEQDLATAAENVYTAVINRFDDEEQVGRALAAFREALLPVLDPPPASRSWLSLRRR